MSTKPPAPDRHAELKARHRRAILQAAKELIVESGDARFSVDQLAERADVARRTVFNHFTSLDDVLTSAYTEIFSVVIDAFREQVSASPSALRGRAAMFDTVTAALRATDVPGTIAFLSTALGGFDPQDRRRLPIFHATFARTSTHLADELAQRFAQPDRLEAELVVSSLIHGVEVIARHWIAETGATTDDAARARWDALLDRLIDSVRAGYGPESTT